MNTKTKENQVRVHPAKTMVRTVGGVAALIATTTALAVVVPGGSNGLDPLMVPQFSSNLIIPPEMPKTAPGSTYNVTGGASADYNIAERQFQQQILPVTGCNARGRAAAGFKAPTCTGAAFKPTTIWSYGRADDAAPAVAPVAATVSSFNYPAFTMETTNGTAVNVRWINELVTLTKWQALGE